MVSSECCICGRQLHTENPKRFFCPKCYHDWEKEIKAGVPWVKYLIANESARRRWDTYTHKGKLVAVQINYLCDDDLYQELGRYKILHDIER